MKVVVVESPAKAKTINKYLGADYHVVASYGHIRDLPSKNGSVVPQEGFRMTWETDARSEKHISDIAKSLKKADELLLATDPDREGEAISWHVLEVMKERGALKNQEIKRIVFHEITKNAVLNALKSPRPVDRALVESYLTRRALDYLVGFTLSPVLWRKLPGARSAGRVQSVALRLVCEREEEIERFVTQEYWTIKSLCTAGQKPPFTARLVTLDGEKLEKFSLGTKEQAEAAVRKILSSSAYTISKIERKQTSRHPSAPFTTSTLQQEASRKLGFSTSRTMQIAQKLYEGIDIGGETVGLITYMRTDSTTVSQDALVQTRALITRDFGEPYLPKSPRVYKTKAKNAQEAHEAIRPTDLTRTPKMVAQSLDEQQRKLYELIWKRMVASQMESAVFDQVSVDITNSDKSIGLRATGTTLRFDGFLKLYEEGKDEDNDKEEESKKLPALEEGEKISLSGIIPEQHFTQPPPRYTEASLVKKLEELGIGRPSTYASILQILQDRHYVRLEKRAFIPEDYGRLVSAFLVNYFKRYVEYSFTADLENQLDDISDGKLKWQQVLQDFWQGFTGAVQQTTDLKISDVLEALNHELEDHFFPTGDNPEARRMCPSCKEGKLSIKLGRYGAFIGCSNYPTCPYTRPLEHGGEGQGHQEASGEYPRILGDDPSTHLPVSVRKGPYGFYLQWGGNDLEKDKLKRLPLPKNLEPATVTLEQALNLTALPRDLGVHPETNAKISAGIGRFGPYVKHQSLFAPLKKEDDVLTISLARALELIAETEERKSKNPRPVRSTARGTVKAESKTTTKSSASRTSAKKGKSTSRKKAE